MILIHDLERWTIFRSGFAMIVNARRCNVGMTKPLLHFGNVRLMIERVGRRSRAQGMRADFEPQFAGVAAHDSIHCVRRQRLIHSPGAVIANRPEEGAVVIISIY